MGWSGGTFTLTDGTYSSNWAVNWRDNGAATILASEFDALMLDVKNGINAAFPADGQKTATGDWDLGTNRLKNITATANTDAGTFGKQVASGAYSSGDDEIQLTLQDATRIDIDVSGLSAGTNGVALTGDQTVAGVKTFSGNTSLSYAKFNGPTLEKLATISSSATPTCDATAANAHFLNVNQNMTLNFTWPSDASDAEVGASWKVHGAILCRWTSGGATFGLNSSMLSALDDYKIEGAPNTTSGEISTLVYNYLRTGTFKYAHFAWVASS